MLFDLKSQKTTKTPPKTPTKGKRTKAAMKQNLLKIVFLSARNLLSPPTFKPNPNYVNASAATFFLKPKFFTSGLDRPHPDPVSDQPQNEDAPTLVEDVTKEEFNQVKAVKLNKELVPLTELKQQIQKFRNGDADAIPSIFEAILKRKLAGKHDESDDEIIKEYGGSPVDDINDEDINDDEDISDDDVSNDDIDSD